MDDNQVWQAIEEERLRLAEILDQLIEKEWRHPPLCKGWMVRDAVAHVTSQELGLFAAIGILIRFAGFRIAATDTPWAVGEGQKVEGPMEAICSC
jgi:Mycothiol maleylpyruvate isomerase N-terminal domain